MHEMRVNKYLQVLQQTFLILYVLIYSIMHKKNLILVSFIILLIFPSSSTMRRLDFRDARLKNVCKDLKGDALLYFIFIDTKTTTPWTEFDIQSTIDSVRAAINWIHSQAKEEKIPLNIVADFYIGTEFTTISRNLPSGTVYESVTEPNSRKAMDNINKWADGAAKIAGKAVTLRSKDGIPEVKNPNNAERLIAFLRDENNVESVGLIYFVNNYYKSDISIPLNTLHTDNVEYAIVSYKYASDIAHNLLHLYGAADLHPTIFRRDNRKVKELKSKFPDDIMQDPYGTPILNMTIGEYTKYLIGWTDKYDPSLEPLMTDKLMKY
jgi:hypothetical protein